MLTKPQHDAARLLQAGPILVSQLSYNKDVAVEQLINTYRTESVTDREIINRVAELTAIARLETQIRNEVNQASKELNNVKTT